MANKLLLQLQQRLAQQQQQHLYRQLNVMQSPQGVEVIFDQQKYLSFCSNDYLGLANHPEIIQALQRGAKQYGVGSGAASLINGYSEQHQLLEQELAEFLQRDRVLLFSTGYMANLGIATALLQVNDRVFADRYNHASLLDSARLVSSKHQRYRHNDMQHLQQLLIKAQVESNTNHQCLIQSDGVFSMEGDFAHLLDLVKLSQHYQTWLVLDDAHGFGVLGANGRGSWENLALNQTQIPILMATMGKAMGCFGAFVAGSEPLIESLIQFARTYLFTTALPPALVMAARKSLAIVKKQAWRRQQLADNIHYFKRSAKQLDLPLLNSSTAIQPLLLKQDHLALEWSQRLWQQGILVSAIRPPTVAKNQARLRITLSTEHQTSHIDYLLEQLNKLYVNSTLKN